MREERRCCSSHAYASRSICRRAVNVNRRDSSWPRHYFTSSCHRSRSGIPARRSTFAADSFRRELAELFRARFPQVDRESLARVSASPKKSDTNKMRKTCAPRNSFRQSAPLSTHSFRFETITLANQVLSAIPLLLRQRTTSVRLSRRTFPLRPLPLLLPLSRALIGDTPRKGLKRVLAHAALRAEASVRAKWCGARRDVEYACPEPPE